MTKNVIFGTLLEIGDIMSEELEVWCDNCGCDDPEIVTRNSCGIQRCENCGWEEDGTCEE